MFAIGFMQNAQNKSPASAGEISVLAKKTAYACSFHRKRSPSLPDGGVDLQKP